MKCPVRGCGFESRALRSTPWQHGVFFCAQAAKNLCARNELSFDERCDVRLPPRKMDGDEADSTHSSSIHPFSHGIGHATPPGLVLWVETRWVASMEFPRLAI